MLLLEAENKTEHVSSAHHDADARPPSFEKSTREEQRGLTMGSDERPRTGDDSKMSLS